jgi:glycosyltransferase involved in cell wall biosynthesis
MISIVMPVRNASHTLEPSLISIQRQSFLDWQLYAVDDASTDDTADVLATYARLDSRIHVLRNRSRLHVAASLNRGIQKCRSTLIARMDGDDIALSDRLQTQYDFMCANIDIHVVGTAVQLMSGDGGSIGYQYRRESHEEIAKYIYREAAFIHPTVMFRRSFIDALGGYNPACTEAEDSDLWLRGYRRFKYHNLQTVHLQYRVPQRVRLDFCYYATIVLLQAARRDHCLMRHGGTALRPLLVGCIGKVCGFIPGRVKQPSRQSS